MSCRALLKKVKTDVLLDFPFTKFYNVQCNILLSHLGFEATFIFVSSVQVDKMELDSSFDEILVVVGWRNIWKLKHLQALNMFR